MNFKDIKRFMIEEMKQHDTGELGAEELDVLASIAAGVGIDALMKITEATVEEHQEFGDAGGIGNEFDLGFGEN